MDETTRRIELPLPTPVRVSGPNGFGPSVDQEAYPYEAPPINNDILGLTMWWRALSEREINDTIPKAVEYGSTDLIDIGVQLGRFIGRALTDAEAAEFGCWFYLIGKMARATSAIERGGMPSDDTLKDLGVYVKMIQRIRVAGGWPGEAFDAH